MSLDVRTQARSAQPVRIAEATRAQREEILRNLLIALSILGPFEIGLNIYSEWVTRSLGMSARNAIVLITLLVSTYLLLLFSTFFRKRWPFTLRAIAVLAFLTASAAVELVGKGLSGNGTITLLMVAALAAILFGTRIGLVTLVVAVAAQIGVGLLMVNRILVLPPFQTMANSGQPDAWILSSLFLGLGVVTVVVSIYSITRGLSQALQTQIRLAADLDRERQVLETRVNQRTEELARKANQLDAARRVAAQIAAETDQQLLLRNAADVILEEFGFYHAGIFLADEHGEYAVLRASTGEVGRTMLESNHKLKIGQVGIVGYVVARGVPRVTPDVDEDPTYYRNPLLPRTRSEMAVPLRLRDQVIGALDVQSDQPNAFAPDDVQVIQTLADQLAVAIDKANLLQRLQANVAELEASYRQSTHQAWNSFFQQARRRYAYRYRNAQVEEITGSPSLQGQTGPQGAVLAVPIELRGEKIGQVNLRVRGTEVSPELADLIQNAVSRLAVALENARLLEENRFRTERRRMIGEISTKVRSATDVDSILKTAASEIGRALGVAEVVVHLDTRE